MANKKALVFDLDGTLIDSAPDIRICLNATLQRYDAGPLTSPQVRSFIGNGAPHLVMLALEASGIPQRHHGDALSHFLSLYNAAHVETALYPHVRETLDALVEAGFAMALCTNKPGGPTDFVLETFDLTRYFPVVIAGDSLPQRKPAPEPLHEAVKRLAAHRALYVGDSEVDAATAEAAKLPFALFTEGYRKKPVEELTFARKFNDFRNLPDIAAALLA